MSLKPYHCDKEDIRKYYYHEKWWQIHFGNRSVSFIYIYWVWYSTRQMYARNRRTNVSILISANSCLTYAPVTNSSIKMEISRSSLYSFLHSPAYYHDCSWKRQWSLLPTAFSKVFNSQFFPRLVANYNKNNLMSQAILFIPDGRGK